MQLSFRLDKRPGESHLALDGKNATGILNLRGPFLCACFLLHLRTKDGPLAVMGTAKNTRVFGGFGNIARRSLGDTGRQGRGCRRVALCFREF